MKLSKSDEIEMKTFDSKIIYSSLEGIQNYDSFLKATKEGDLEKIKKFINEGKINGITSLQGKDLFIITIEKARESDKDTVKILTKIQSLNLRKTSEISKLAREILKNNSDLSIVCLNSSIYVVVKL